MLPDGELADAAAWTRCDASTAATLASSCDFETCLIPPDSFCSYNDTCSSRSCDDWQFKDTGCQRPPCESDEDCASEERCVVLESISVAQCSYAANGECNCGGPTIDLSGAFCNPTVDAGPGGAWEELIVLDDVLPCTLDTCAYEWHVAPDGEIQMRKLGVDSTATLTSGDLAEIELVINGPDLRYELEWGACPAENREVTFGLVLPEQTVLNSAAGCIEGDPNNPYHRIWTVLQKY
jgi:hypothetical protein